MNFLEQLNVTMGEIASLAMGNIPTSYVENGENIWNAFRLGEKYAKLKVQSSQGKFVCPSCSSKNVEKIFQCHDCGDGTDWKQPEEKPCGEGGK